VTARALIQKLQPFEGKQLIACIDEITAIATSLHFSVNVIDPAFNVSSIDEDPWRLNVRTDRDSIITKFTIG